MDLIFCVLILDFGRRIVLHCEHLNGKMGQWSNHFQILQEVCLGYIEPEDLILRSGFGCNSFLPNYDLMFSLSKVNEEYGFDFVQQFHVLILLPVSCEVK